MNPFVEQLELAADFVQRWGGADVGERLTLRDALTIDGVPFWDALVVDLALYRVPNIANGRAASRLIQLIRPMVAPFRYRSHPDFSGDSLSELPRAADRALLLGFSPYMTRDVIAPIALQLEVSSRLQPIILGPRQQPSADSGGVNYATWSAYWNRTTRRRATELSSALGRRLRFLKTLIADAQRFGVDHAARPVTAARIMNSFAEYGRYVLAPHAAIAEAVIEKLAPRVIVSPDVADPRTRLYSLLSAQQAIPTLEVQLGAFGPEATEWRFFHSTAVAVWGDYSKRVLARHGVLESRIVVTGSPRHDSLADATPAERQEVRRRFNVPVSHRTVVLASVYSLAAYQTPGELAVLRAMKRDTFAAAARHDRLTLIVKPHPLEDVKETRSLAANAANIVFADRADDIRSLIRACDALLTFGSTVTLDALILDRATVSLAYPGWEWGELFVEGDATAVCKNQSDIANVLREIGDDGGAAMRDRHSAARRQFVSDWIGSAHGAASTRIATLVSEMALGTIGLS